MSDAEYLLRARHKSGVVKHTFTTLDEAEYCALWLTRLSHIRRDGKYQPSFIWVDVTSSGWGTHRRWVIAYSPLQRPLPKMHEILCSCAPYYKKWCECFK